MLEYLGESLPDKLDKESIERELRDAYIKVQNLPISLDQLPIMENPQKKQAMVSNVFASDEEAHSDIDSSHTAIKSFPRNSCSWHYT